MKSPADPTACFETLTNAKWKITLVFSKVRFKTADMLLHLPEEVVLCGIKFSTSKPIYERRGSVMTFKETNTSPYVQLTSGLLMLTCTLHITDDWPDTLAHKLHM